MSNAEVEEMTKEEDSEGKYWKFESIIGHRRNYSLSGRYEVLVKWLGYNEPTWEPMEVLKQDDPVTLAKYARKQRLTNISDWEWAKHSH